MSWTTNLRRNAIAATVIPLLMNLFLGGDLGTATILDGLGLPSDGWTLVTWRAWTGTEFPNYLFKLGVIASSISLFAGLLKLFLPDQLIEALGLQEGMMSLTQADWAIIVAWVVLALPLMILVDFPLEPVPLLQLIPYLGLQVSFFWIAGILDELFPNKVTGMKKVLVISPIVILVGVVLAFVFTHLFLLPIRLLDFYGLPL